MLTYYAIKLFQRQLAFTYEAVAMHAFSIERSGKFLDLCTAAWPDFESAYDSQIVGLWRAAPDEGDTVRSLLVTRRPDLAMWERSKLPANEAEAETRRKLSRRYDLCDDTVVYTSTLLTANDREDTARWT